MSRLDDMNVKLEGLAEAERVSRVVDRSTTLERFRRPILLRVKNIKKKNGKECPPRALPRVPSQWSTTDDDDGE
jgi:hypothetical protein